MLAQATSVALGPSLALADSSDATLKRHPTADALIEKARAQNLAKAPQWLTLLRYKRTRFGATIYRSDVVSESFFLSPNGDKNPDAELEAALQALFAPIPADPNTHAQCKFPARSLWLQRRLGFTLGGAEIDCPEHARWTKEGSLTGASVILASGYLSNPSSVYGHLLLKFRTDEPLDRDGLLAAGVNYGAAESEDDPIIPYIFKGLTGGYRSTFTHLDFYHHNHRYTEAQLRDVWEYKLDITQDDVDLLAAHVWELLGQDNKYYFLRQNCAFRIAEVVSLITDAPVYPEWKPWVTPIDVFDRLAGQTVDARPIVADVRRLPSRQSAFREGFDALSPSGQRSVRRLITTDAAPVADSVRDLPDAEQSAALETALDYFAFAAKAEGGALPENTAQRRHEVLLARMERPAGQRMRSGDTELDAVHRPPHTGQKSSLLQASALYNDELGAGVELRARAAYYDFLSLDPGTLPYSELSMGDLRLIARDGDISLRQLEIIRVTTLNVSPTGAPHDSAPAWRLRFGAENRDLSCDDCLVGYVEGGVGKAKAFGDQAAAFAMATGRLQAGDNDDNFLQGGVTAGVVAGGGPWKAALETGVLQQADGPQDALPFVRLDTRLGASPNWDVRLGVEHNQALESRARFSLYW